MKHLYTPSHSALQYLNSVILIGISVSWMLLKKGSGEYDVSERNLKISIHTKSWLLVATFYTRYENRLSKIPNRVNFFYEEQRNIDDHYVKFQQ